MKVDDYRSAPSGEGPLSGEWKDKPHRLVYDLCARVSALEVECEAARNVLGTYPGGEPVDRLLHDIAFSVTSRLEQEIERLQDGCLVGVIDRQTCEIERLRKDLRAAAKMCAKHATAYARAESAESALEDLQKKWTCVPDEYANMQEFCDALKEIIHDMEDDFEKVMDERDEARSELEEARNDIGIQNKEIAEWRNLLDGDGHTSPGDVRDLESDLKRAESALEELRSKLWEWTRQYGKSLCPPGADTYGEGVRDCKQQVATMLKGCRSNDN